MSTIIACVHGLKSLLWICTIRNFLPYIIDHSWSEEKGLKWSNSIVTLRRTFKMWPIPVIYRWVKYIVAWYSTWPKVNTWIIMTWLQGMFSELYTCVLEMLPYKYVTLRMQNIIHTKKAHYFHLLATLTALTSLLRVCFHSGRLWRLAT